MIENLNLKVSTIVNVLIIPIMSSAVYLLKEMNTSIQDLNTKMAIVIVEGNHQKEKLKDFENRIRVLELREK